jgi:uncharacterized iron-regulated membrane protein
MTRGLTVRIRRILAFIHLWLGLILFIPLVVLGLTGSILVFGDELNLAMGTAPPSATASGPARPVSEIITAARTAAPQGANPVGVRLGEAPGEPTTVRFAVRRDPSQPAPQGPPGLAGTVPVYVDAASLQVLETGPVLGAEGQSFMRLMHNLHGNLLITGRTGREVVGWFGVVMLFLGVSGMVMWWPRRGQWKRGFTVRWGASAQTFNRDLHGATGIWLWLVFIIISFSGIYIVFPQTMSAPLVALFGPVTPQVPSVTIPAPAPGAQRISTDAAVAAARQAAGGDVELRAVTMPGRGGQPYRITLAEPGSGHGVPAITAFVDDITGQVLEMRDPRRFNAAETFMAWQRPIHYGEGLGWVWKMLTFISGLLPLLFVVTGFSLWLAKRRNRRAAASRAALAIAASKPVPAE